MVSDYSRKALNQEEFSGHGACLMASTFSILSAEIMQPMYVTDFA